MNWRSAFIRGLRTFFQSLAGLMIAIPTANSVLDIQVAITNTIPLVLWSAFLAGVVSFAQNVGEDATHINVPKG